MRVFQYLKPKSIEDAIGMLDRYGMEAKLIAGGTDLLIQMEKKSQSYNYLIGLKFLESLSYIKDDMDQRIVRIGSMTLIQDIVDSQLIKDKFCFLAEACRQLGSMQVRNIATLGGNLCNASPSAETAPSLLVLGTQVVSMGSKGRQIFPLEKFFHGPGQTGLARDEVLLEVQVPYPTGGVCGFYQKLAHRRALDIGIVNVSILMKIGRGEICEVMKLALGAVAPVPLRLRRAEELIIGKKLSEGLIQEVAQIASDEANPINDVRGTAEYRKKMIRVLVSRGMEEIWKSA